MTLTTMQFDILVFVERYATSHLTIEEIAARTHYSMEETTNTLKALNELNYINDQYEVTKAGYAYLSPYRVQKAIFMAAGFGSRMVPMTLSMPKPLIKVHGKRIIETLLDALLDAGITDITIVRGYQAEAFDMLLGKYPMLKFIENPTYNEANNIGSALKFKEMMANAYILESDLVLSNPDIIRRYERHTNYMGKYVSHTDDWCFDVQDEIIQQLHSDGGDNCFHMYGISYWTKEDAQKMASDIPGLYESEGGKQKYFDEVALRYGKDHYQIHVRPVYEGDIVEIDTFKELQDIDESYR